MGGAGEVDAEGGSFAGFGFEGDVAVVFFDDAAGGGESESGASAFGGEVCVEDVGEIFFGDADAGVGDVEDECVVFAEGSDEEFAAVGHGLDGVEHEIEEGLFDEVGVEGAVGVVGGEGGEDADFVGLCLGVDEVDEVLNEGVEGDAFEAEFDAAGEFEEVVEGLAEAFGFFFEGGETGEGTLCAGECGEVFFHELEVEL